MGGISRKMWAGHFALPWVKKGNFTGGGARKRTKVVSDSCANVRAHKEEKTHACEAYDKMPVAALENI